MVFIYLTRTVNCIKDVTLDQEVWTTTRTSIGRYDGIYNGIIHYTRKETI